jgi:hypothetical protein
VVFFAWFAMRFFMDTANDSETLAYSAVLFANAFRGGASVDGTGHATLFAQYVLALFAQILQPITGAYLIRALVTVQLAIGLLLFAAAHWWYRRLGLAWLTRLLGLNMLSICVAFARQSRGWELDKLLEPTLYLLAAIAMWDRRYIMFVGLAALAAINRETGVFVPLIALTSERSDSEGSPWWLMWGSAFVSLAIVLAVRLFGPQPAFTPAAAVASNLDFERIVYVAGGLCLVPLFAVAWLRWASPFLRRLSLVMAPVWLIWVLTTDSLEQGARLLGMVAVLFIPLTLQGVQRGLARAVVPGPAAQEAR